MIRSFKSRDAQALFGRQRVKRLSPDLQRSALRKLRMLNRAQTLQDLRVPPSNRLEALRGERKGQYSIRINDPWRICFVWSTPDAYDVEIVDDH